MNRYEFGQVTLVCAEALDLERQDPMFNMVNENQLIGHWKLTDIANSPTVPMYCQGEMRVASTNDAANISHARYSDQLDQLLTLLGYKATDSGLDQAQRDNAIEIDSNPWYELFPEEFVDWAYEVGFSLEEMARYAEAYFDYWQKETV